TVSKPPPKPCTKRPATTWPIDGASAQISAPAPKISAPVQNALRAPTIAVRYPVQVAATIDEARKALLVQLIKVAPPTSSTTLGSTVASISTFIECSSTPPTKTDTAGSQAGRSSAAQPSVLESLPMAAVCPPSRRLACAVPRRLF